MVGWVGLDKTVYNICIPYRGKKGVIMNEKYIAMDAENNCFYVNNLYWKKFLRDHGTNKVTYFLNGSEDIVFKGGITIDGRYYIEVDNR